MRESPKYPRMARAIVLAAVLFAWSDPAISSQVTSAESGDERESAERELDGRSQEASRKISPLRMQFSMLAMAAMLGIDFAAWDDEAEAYTFGDAMGSLMLYIGVPVSLMTAGSRSWQETTYSVGVCASLAAANLVLLRDEHSWARIAGANLILLEVLYLIEFLVPEGEAGTEEGSGLQVNWSPEGPIVGLSLKF